MVNVNNLRSGRAGITGRQNSASSTSPPSGENLMKIVEEILNKPSLTVSADKIRKEIVKFFKESEREGVETQSFKISLLDPLSRKRIRIPVRSVGCDHFQCFDLYNFLDFSYGSGSAGGEEGAKTAWRCPHCQTEAKQEQLRIDGYFQEILLKVGPEPQEVEIFPDGQWKEVEQIDFKDVFPIEKDDDDVVEIVPRKKQKVQDDDNGLGESSSSSNALFPTNGIGAEGTSDLNCNNVNASENNRKTLVASLNEILGIDTSAKIGAEGENEENKRIIAAVRKLKRKATTVDRIRQMLALEDEEDDSEENENEDDESPLILAVQTQKQNNQKQSEVSSHQFPGGINGSKKASSPSAKATRNEKALVFSEPISQQKKEPKKISLAEYKRRQQIRQNSAEAEASSSKSSLSAADFQKVLSYVAAPRRQSPLKKSIRPDASAMPSSDAASNSRPHPQQSYSSIRGLKERILFPQSLEQRLKELSQTEKFAAVSNLQNLPPSFVAEKSHGKTPRPVPPPPSGVSNRPSGFSFIRPTRDGNPMPVPPPFPLIDPTIEKMVSSSSSKGNRNNAGPQDGGSIPAAGVVDVHNKLGYLPPDKRNGQKGASSDD